MTPVLAGLLLLVSGELTVADFEGDSYGPWQTSGTAFGTGPAKGTLPGQMAVSGYRGKGLVNSFLGGDGSVGTLTSPEFLIRRRTLRFLIGGGKDLERTAMFLLVDGKIVRRATGQNERPGGTEALEPGFWDVREFVGKTARIQIVDRATGGWGHINVDHIVQTDSEGSGLMENVQREFAKPGRYLRIPIRNDAPKRRVSLLIDGHTPVRNEIELAEGKPDWWAVMDLGENADKKVILQIDKLPEDSNTLKAVTRGDTRKDGPALYREPLRGQFHFSPKRGWNNDPNGLVYYRGEYHLFFQFNPYGWGWGNMHWGHAVSKDLIHWEEIGVALAPDDMGPMFSGSAVVDWKNSSGLGDGKEPPLVLIYTAAGNPAVQGLASSIDGRTFAKYPGNPVIPEFTPGNRDPKVVWHAPTQRWVMVLYVETKDGHTIRFLNSSNLKDWTTASEIEGFYECPDLFELPYGQGSKWVLTGASSEYRVGTFDGRVFTPETPMLPGHRGKGFYAAQTFSDLPDGRRIQIGWFQTETKGMPFNQSMSVPLELGLATTPEGPRLTMNPAKELAGLRSEAFSLKDLAMSPETPNPLAAKRVELAELNLDIVPSPDALLALNVRGAEIVYDAKGQTLSVDGHKAPAPLQGGRLQIRILCDRTGLEVFASGGLTYVPMPFQPDPKNRSLSVKVAQGSAQLKSLELYTLKSAWKR